MKNSPRVDDGAIDRATAQAASRHLLLVKPTNPAVSSDGQGVPPSSATSHGPNPDDPAFTILVW
jgi:hypothetical protein